MFRVDVRSIVGGEDKDTLSGDNQQKELAERTLRSKFEEVDHRRHLKWFVGNDWEEEEEGEESKLEEADDDSTGREADDDEGWRQNDDDYDYSNNDNGGGDALAMR